MLATQRLTYILLFWSFPIHVFHWVRDYMRYIRDVFEYMYVYMTGKWYFTEKHPLIVLEEAPPGCISLANGAVYSSLGGQAKLFDCTVNSFERIVVDFLMETYGMDADTAKLETRRKLPFFRKIQASLDVPGFTLKRAEFVDAGLHYDDIQTSSQSNGYLPTMNSMNPAKYFVLESPGHVEPYKLVPGVRMNRERNLEAEVEEVLEEVEATYQTWQDDFSG